MSSLKLNIYSGGVLVPRALSPTGEPLGPVVIDLAGLEFTEGRAYQINWGHSPHPIGTHTVRVVGGELIGDGEYMPGLSAASLPLEFMVAARAGLLEVSIEANIIEMEYLPAGQSAGVNGRVFAGPLNIVRKSRYLGCAAMLSGLAADPCTAVIAASSAASVRMTPLAEGVSIMADQPSVPVTSVTPDVVPSPSPVEPAPVPAEPPAPDPMALAKEVLAKYIDEPAYAVKAVMMAFDGATLDEITAAIEALKREAAEAALAATRAEVAALKASLARAASKLEGAEPPVRMVAARIVDGGVSVPTEEAFLASDSLRSRFASYAGLVAYAKHAAKLGQKVTF